MPRNVVQRRIPQAQSRIIADAKAFWCGSETRSETRDLSHWLGVGRWSDQDAWDRIGLLHYEMFEKLCLLAGVTRPIERMVEWGPGGGANAVLFCREAKEFYGIDISAPSLRECQRQIESRNLMGFHPILIDSHHPQKCREQIDSPVDFFLSTAVYQHFPSKEYGVRITQLACELLTDRGVALIQTRYDDGTIKYRSKHRDYRENVIRFTSYGIVEFWRVAKEIGFNPLAVILEPEVNYAFYFLEKRLTND